MFGLSFGEIGLVLLVALIVLGPKRLPPIARSLGQALRMLQRSSSDLRQAVMQPLEEVREPLAQVREDLYETVSHLGKHLQVQGHTIEHLEEPSVVSAIPPQPAVPPQPKQAVHSGLAVSDALRGGVPDESDEGRVNSTAKSLPDPARSPEGYE